MGVPDRRPGHLPLGRDEPRLRARGCARLHPVRRLRQHLAAVARERRAGTSSAGPPIVLNQWTHLVGTYDGTTARLYVNGALAGSSGSRLPAEHAAAAADRERRDRSRRPSTSCPGAWTRWPSTAARFRRHACRRTTRPAPADSVRRTTALGIGPGSYARTASRETTSDVRSASRSDGRTWSSAEEMEECPRTRQRGCQTGLGSGS